ncbi:hypothetical protein FE848_17445 [Marinobacter sp. 1-3A]|jgi:hypothetical protein|uniref:hypothetical protein n=1 Tax=Marinobacter sp. 1-3A TaxID=2582920 RepID=UPI0019030AE1|nr:hypothetical protein [Marinobacter sp. 1-3A]MBK1875012.1 hypothetical protein [Marinobacter sp. 1-3A]
MPENSGDASFDQWIEKLHTLADQEACEWIVPDDPLILRQAYEEGLTPEDEYDRLNKVAAWHGCGCG